MKQTVKMKLWIKIVAILAVIICVLVVIMVAVDQNYNLSDKLTITILSAILGVFWFVWLIYLMCLKIVVSDDQFKVRLFFFTRVYKIANITNVNYKRIAFGDITYVVRFGKHKMEVSPLMRNKEIIDKKLDENGVFKKFPRAKI